MSPLAIIPAAPALLAAIDPGLITALLVIFFVIVPAIGQLLTKMREEAKMQARPKAPQRPPNAGIQQEIDEFLRRASQRRADRPVQPPSPIEEYQAQEIVAAELVEDETPVGDRMVRQVQQDMDTSEFARRGAQFGEEVAQADEQFDERVVQMFSHEVSRLSMRPGTSAAPPVADESSEAPETYLAEMTATTTGLATAFSDPNSILQAIVMTEILRRPEW